MPMLLNISRLLGLLAAASSYAAAASEGQPNRGTPFSNPVPKHGCGPVLVPDPSDRLDSECTLQRAGVRSLADVAAVLNAHGVVTATDLREFNSHEFAELTDALREGGVSLTDRSKIRVFHESPLHEQQPQAGYEGEPSHVPAADAFPAAARGPVHVARRGAQAAEDVQATSDQGGGISGDTIAVMATVLLGLGSFLLQAKVSRDADRNQRNIEIAQSQHEKDKTRAAVQIERVRSQMAEALQPLNVLLNATIETGSWLIHELQLVETEAIVLGSETFVRPFPNFPHVELKFASKASSFFMPNMYGALQFGPADLAAIQADPAKLERYVEVQAYAQVPLYREIAAVFRRTRHLLEYPDSDPMIEQIFNMNGIDSKAVHLGNYANVLAGVSAYCDAWNPIVKRFERGDYTIMQPMQANDCALAMIVVFALCQAAAKAEVILQGTTGGSTMLRANVDTIKKLSQPATET
jgi:hypothetical protein